MKEKHPINIKKMALRIAGSLLVAEGGGVALTHAGIVHALNNPQPDHIRQAEGFVPKPEYPLIDLKTLKDESVQPDEDPIKNVKINEEIPFTWFHPMSAKGDVWSYGVVLRDSSLYGDQKSLSDQGNVGEIFLNSSSDLGVDIKTNIQYLNDYKGNGARAAIWLTAGAKDLVILMDETNDQAPLPVAAATADEKGFAGFLLPDRNIQIGIRIVRQSGKTDPVRLTFGNISNVDFADPQKRNHPSVIDADKFLKESSAVSTQTPVVQTPVEQQPIAISPEPQASSRETLPDFLTESSVSTFQDASSNAYFLAQSSKSEGWSHFVEFKLPEKTPGVFYRDRGNVGEVFVQTRGLGTNAVNSFDLYMRTNPIFVEDYRQGVGNRPAIWFKTQPGTLIQLLNSNNEVLTFISDGKKYPIQSTVDGAGFGGLVLPDYIANVKARIILPHPEVDTDTQIQFGPERPQDKGKASTLDSTAWIPRP